MTRSLSVRSVVCIVALMLAEASVWQTATQAQSPAGTQNPVEIPPTTENSVAAVQRNYYVESRGYGTRRITEPPPYLRTLSKAGIPGYEDYSWLDFGLDYRMRYEYL